MTDHFFAGPSWLVARYASTAARSFSPSDSKPVGMIDWFDDSRPAMSRRCTTCFWPVRSVSYTLVCVSASSRPAKVSPDRVVRFQSR